MKLEFLWEEEKTRTLFRTHLILFLIGGIVATIYTLLLPADTAYRVIVIAIPSIFTLSVLIYLILLARPNPQLRFLIFTLESQLAAAIFMAITGGFLGIVQFAPYMFLLFAVFELGAQATLILGSFSILTFIGVLLWGIYIGTEANILQHFFYYVGSYILIMMIENNIGKELSIQFEAKKRLEQIDDLKNQFITLTSHYLRTPITIIKGFIGKIEQAQLNNQQKADIQKVDITLENLENMIEKLLIISSIEKGQAKISLVPSDINTLITAAITQFQPLASMLQVNLTYSPPALPIPQFLFDPVRIKEVLCSLIDNSLRYNKPGGSAAVSAVLQDKKVIIRVADTGQGIKSDHLNTLFSPFNRGNLSQALKTDKPGLGLSLHIAKLVVEVHKGKITAASTEGQGSAFTIVLPLSQKNRTNFVP